MKGNMKKSEKTVNAISAEVPVAAGKLSKSGGEGEYRRVPWAEVRPSATNPRKVVESELAEMKASILTPGVGIIEPLIVRPLPQFTLHEPDMVDKTWRITDADGKEVESMSEGTPLAEALMRESFKLLSKYRYEIICGEKRWRSAGPDWANLKEIPVIVRAVDEGTALAIQLLENLDRSGFSPFEEAAGYEQLMKRMGWTVDDLLREVDSLGKKRATVYARLKLLKLAPAVQEALKEGKIECSVAGHIGKVPGFKLQEKALKYILDHQSPTWDHEEGSDNTAYSPMSARAVALYIKNEFFLDLKDAKFDTTLEYPRAVIPGRIVTKVCDGVQPSGLLACTHCPRRSGNAREEFPEIKSTDMCTDSECYHAKEAAVLEVRMQDYRDQGLEILSAKQSKGLFQYGYLRSNADYMDPEKGVYEAGNKPLKSVIKKAGLKRVVAVNDHGEPVELFKREEVQTALLAVGIKPREESKPATPEEIARAEAQNKLKLAVNQRCLESIIESVKTQVSKGKLEDLLRYLLKDEDADAPKGSIEKMKAPELAGLLVKASALDYDDEPDEFILKEMAQVWPVDRKAIEKEVKAEQAKLESSKPEELTAKNAKSAKKGGKGK